MTSRTNVPLIFISFAVILASTATTTVGQPCDADDDGDDGVDCTFNKCTSIDSTLDGRRADHFTPGGRSSALWSNQKSWKPRRSMVARLGLTQCVGRRAKFRWPRRVWSDP